MVSHCCICFEQKSQLWGTFMGGGGVKTILQHLYLNVYAQFESRISYNILHDYQWACEISKVRNSCEIDIHMDYIRRPPK